MDAMDEKPGEQEKDREQDRLEKMAEKELEAIEEQSPGSKKPKKRVIRPSEKFRFSFHWENTEDSTNRDMDALYQTPHEARLLGGRGFLAVRDMIDRREAAAAASALYLLS